MTDALSPSVFAILSALVEERVGLSFAPSDAATFGVKVAAVVAESGFATPLDYYYALRYDDASGELFTRLVDTLVVGETYFFRESEPLLAVIEHVVRPAVASRGRARVWSAACSTGEEPLSIAMLLERAGLGDKVSITASDVSDRSVERAKKAVYGGRSMRAVLDPALHVGISHEEIERMSGRWLEARGGSYHARRELVDRIAFRQMNLLDAAAAASLGTFDLIVCRNVLIYFSDGVVRKVVDALASRLAETGRLLIGASESLMRFGTVLQCEERGGAFFYGRGRR